MVCCIAVNSLPTELSQKPIKSMNQGKLEMVKQEQPPGVKKRGGGGENPKYGIYYRKLNILVTLVTKSIGGRLCVIKK